MIIIKSFQELTNKEVYELLKLRLKASHLFPIFLRFNLIYTSKSRILSFYLYFCTIFLS